VNALFLPIRLLISRRVPALAAGAALVLLTACGGGGGGSTPAPAANQAPTAVAKLSGEAVLYGTTVFDTTGTADPDGTIASRNWNYGDGQTGTVDNHVYAATGNYTATLTVTDNQNATASTSVAVTVAKCSVAGTHAASLSPFTTLCVQTSLGEMVFELFAAQAPVTVANFLKYVDDGFYSGTLFHRVIANFVVQGGGYTAGMVAKTPTYAPIVLESNNGLSNRQYTLAMARTSVADSATSQFYVNLVDNLFLDYSTSVAGPNGYAVFGQVLFSGTATVDAIGRVATNAANDVPLKDVILRSVVRLP
jgi:cyclophilin family peptidyl-prolyl cis-trans isomerase